MQHFTITRLASFLSSVFASYLDDPGGAPPVVPPANNPVVPPAGDPPKDVPPKDAPPKDAPPAADPLDLTKPAAPAATPEAEFEPTGDPGLDLALEFFASKGIGADHKALLAAQKGDFALLEATLSVMGDKAKGWEKFLALGKRSYETVKTQAEAKVAAAKKDIEDAVGGAEEWTAIRTWASQAGTEQDRQEATAALRAGGVQAKAMALYLQGVYRKVADIKVPGKVATDHASGRAPVSQPMTAVMYADQVQALRSKYGNIDNHPEYKALQARRAAARAAGI